MSNNPYKSSSSSHSSGTYNRKPYANASSTAGIKRGPHAKGRSGTDNTPNAIPPLLQIPINQLFIPRPPLRYVPPMDRPFEQRIGVRVSAIAPILMMLNRERHHKTTRDKEQTMSTTEDIMETDSSSAAMDDDLEQGEIVESMDTSNNNTDKRELTTTQSLKGWDPFRDPNIPSRSSPHHTIYIGRLPKSIGEERLHREMSRFGDIVGLRLVRKQPDRNEDNDRSNQDKKESSSATQPNEQRLKNSLGVSCGYAFVEYERERDVRMAIRHAHGMKLDGKRIVVEGEKGRTAEGWLPMRLRNGKASTSGHKKTPVNIHRN